MKSRSEKEKSKTVERTIEIEFPELLSKFTNAVNILKDLFKSNTNSEVEKRAFVRAFADIGECMTFFKNIKLLPLNFKKLHNLKYKDGDSEKSIVLDFINYRNILLHDYIIQHILGNENNFDKAFAFANNNILILENALDQLKDEEITCKKQYSSSHDDNTEYNALDYVYFTQREINVLLDINKQSSDKIPAILNCIENICVLLVNFNKCLKKADKDIHDKCHSLTEETLDAISTSFLINTGKIRISIAHFNDLDFNPNNEIGRYITCCEIITNKYLSKVFAYLAVEKQIPFHEDIQNIVKKRSRVYSSETIAAVATTSTTTSTSQTMPEEKKARIAAESVSTTSSTPHQQESPPSNINDESSSHSYRR